MKNFGYLSDNLELAVTCASGLESVLKKELYRLGYGDVPANNGTLVFSGGLTDIAKCNIHLRTADRVYIKVKDFTAITFDQLFENVKEIKWEEFFPEDASVIVDGKCVKSTLFAISSCQSVIKKAISLRLCEKYKVNTLEETGAFYTVQFTVFKDVCSLYIDTSGVGLHKRGYRDKVGIAPIKETLASALLLYSDFYYKNPLLDPFCGSGTIAIEGAKIMLDIAPNILRTFAFNDWQNYPEELFKKVYEQAKDNEKRDRKVQVFASDVDKKAIALAKYHAERAGLKDVIKFDVKDVKDVKLYDKNGTIVSNPPYGERVYDKKQAEECYRKLGEVVKKNPTWSAFIITSDKAFEKFYGKKADRKRKLYNSDKECNYYYYYAKKDKQKEE